MDRRDIFNILAEKGTQIMYLNSHDTLMSKEGYDNQNELKWLRQLLTVGIIVETTTCILEDGHGLLKKIQNGEILFQ